MKLSHFLLPLLATSTGASAADASDWLAIHEQATFVLQATPGFASPYVGTNSLTPHQRKETFDWTAYVGVRPWAGGEFWINPEVDQGFGLSNTLGVAGFPSAEAYKVGKKQPYVRVQRAFFRQTIDLGGETVATAAQANWFAASPGADRTVLTVGKFGVGDIFDTNAYAHDPRGDFLNWTAVDSGNFDYAADAWGYSQGAAIEYYRGKWTWRAGLFNLSTVPNGEKLEIGFNQFQIDGEIEHRHTIAGRAGAVRLTAFYNRGRFGRFADALALASQTGAAPDTALVRARRTRLGIDLNVEQSLTDTIGLFVRAGASNGATEPYDFTDVDRTAAAGLSIKGNGWGRDADTIGAAAVINAISAVHEQYLDSGGIGVLVGDGRLPHPGPEAIGEFYYQWQVARPLALTLDYQIVGNPGYNRDRGPANVFAMRVHAAF